MATESVSVQDIKIGDTIESDSSPGFWLTVDREPDLTLSIIEPGVEEYTAYRFFGPVTSPKGDHGAGDFAYRNDMMVTRKTGK